MLRNVIFSLGIAVAAVFLVPSAANAATEGYPPGTPTTPTLAGSTAIAECVGDVPWIQFSVDLVDPDNQSTGHTATLVMTDGANSVEVPLGALQGNHLNGRVLWPGASVDAAGNANGWPGWEKAGNEWVPTTGNFAWTRGAITAELRVNPSLSVPLTYPPASAKCAQPASEMGLPLTNEPAGLALTGGAVPVLAIGIGGAAVILGGALLLKRRQQHKH